MVSLIDAGQFTWGNAVTILVFAIGAGGTCASIKAGLSEVKAKQVEDAAHVATELTAVHSEIADLRKDFVRKDVDRERDERVSDKMSSMADRIKELEVAFRENRR